jgi:hypothetical protein
LIPKFFDVIIIGKTFKETSSSSSSYLWLTIPESAVVGAGVAAAAAVLGVNVAGLALSPYYLAILLYC